MSIRFGTIKCVLIVAFAAILGGCSGTLSFNDSPDLQPASANFYCEREIAMQNLKDSLSDVGFQIEKFDVDAGYILTSPLRGGQLFEFWRGDNTTAKDEAYANVQSIVRIGEFQFTDNSISGAVVVKQLAFDRDQVSEISRIDRVFAKSSGGTASLNIGEKNADSMEWIYKGRDVELEKRLLESFN